METIYIKKVTVCITPQDIPITNKVKVYLLVLYNYYGKPFLATRQK